MTPNFCENALTAEKKKKIKLICISGQECSFYRATIAPYYNPDNNEYLGGPPAETVNGACYSLWIFENDITDYHSGILVDSVWPPIYPTYNTMDKEKAVDGYSCDQSDNAYYHSAWWGHAGRNFFELEFPTHVRVTSVLFKPRITHLQGSPSHFINMETRVGNYSGYGNLAMNVKIGNTETFVGGDGLVKFDAAPNSIVGRFVIIHQTMPGGNQLLIIEEMKVIGHVV